MKNGWIRLLVGLIALGVCPPVAFAELQLRDICRLKGQEENVLQGMGLVVGLRGTGDGDTPTLRMLSQMMRHLGGEVVSTGSKGQSTLEELKNVKNVAAVMVSVKVPAEGAREGSQLTCTVQSLGAKSLEGGVLLQTPLLGPRPGIKKIYGFAQGPLALEGNNITTAKIEHGCRMESDIQTSFVENGRITLVLNQSHASFQIAHDIEELVNNERDFSNGVAKALDQVNIEITIPDRYRDNPVEFASYVMSLRIAPPNSGKRVVIGQRNGVIVMNGDVEIGAVAVTHKSLAIQTGGTNPLGQFVPIDTASDTSVTKLQALVNALNAVKVPAEDIIDIIKVIERSGRLYGHVIYE